MNYPSLPITVTQCSIFWCRYTRTSVRSVSEREPPLVRSSVIELKRDENAVRRADGFRPSFWRASGFSDSVNWTH